MKILATLTALVAGPALAQPLCMPSVVAIEALAKEYSEVVAFSGLMPDGNAMHLWVNVTTGSFTVTGSTPGGTTCILGHGTDGTLVAVPAPGTDG